MAYLYSEKGKKSFQAPRKILGEKEKPASLLCGNHFGLKE